MEGRPRLLWRISSSGAELDEGSLFSESDWLIAASAGSPSATTTALLFNPEELASSGAPASAVTLAILATLSASGTHTHTETGNTLQQHPVYDPSWGVNSRGALRQLLKTNLFRRCRPQKSCISVVDRLYGEDGLWTRRRWEERASWGRRAASRWSPRGLGCSRCPLGKRKGAGTPE